MKELLERHAERLAPEERLAIWQRISGANAGRQPSIARWAVPATALATAAAALLVFTLQQREPAVVTPVTPVRVSEPVAVVEPKAVETPVETPAPAVAKPRTARVQETAPSPQAIAAAAPPAPVAARAPVPVTNGRGVLTGKVTDRHGQPVAYANVIVLGTNLGTLTDANGVYRVVGVSADSHQVKVALIGYAPSVTPVRVGDGQVTSVDVRLGEELVATSVNEVEVRAEKKIDTKSSATKQTISAEQLRRIPIDNLGQAVGTQPGVVTQGGNLHYRGGRSDEVKFQVDGQAAAPPANAPASPPLRRSALLATPPAAGVPAAPPVIPTTGGTALPNDEAFDSMFFRNYGVNPFVPTDEDALSTFAVDVDAASYTVTRRYLGLGHLPPADAVRVEEFVNFFPQGYPRFENEDFRIVMDGAPSPFGPGYQLLRVGIKGREVVARNRKPARLTFVVDVSGSMNREDRLGLVKRALGLLVDQLREDDRVGLVVYGSQGRVVLEPAAIGRKGEGRARLLAAIEKLTPDGSTNAEEGLRLGYEMARRAFRPEAINRIVLCSDGVANVGITGPETILAQVRSEADRGITLTTIGFGMGNYNDVLMEQLADKGDGNHYYVDDIGEARRVFVENLTGTLQVIAKDAKVQVEFDSTTVVRYRLIGFENRDVADRDFRNDKVDAGEIGAGHEVTALYEVKLAPNVTRGRLATVRFRWARPEQEAAGAPQVREIEQRFEVASLARRFEDAAPHFRLDAAVAEFAEILRGSYWARESALSSVLAVARSAAAALNAEKADELVTLVGKAAALKGAAQPGGIRR